MALEKLIRERKVLRSGIKSKENSLDITLSGLKDKGRRLFELDKSIKDLMDEDDMVTEEEMIIELSEIEEYRLLYFNMEEKLQRAACEERPKAGTKIKLPDIKLPTFDGEPSKWIQFWGQFQKIHDSGEIVEQDKYQFLLSATSGKARVLVDSYPPTAGNYEKVVECLKKRFAGDNVLIDFYVRNLLQIMHVQLGPHPLKLTQLYDSLCTNLNNLNALGLTNDKYALMLLPLIESSLPKGLLKTWERIKNQKIMSSISGSISSIPCETEKENSLSELMDFLRLEVESEERIESSQPSTSRYEEEERCTGAMLVSQGKITGCIFCEKSNHTSVECMAAQKLTYDERKMKLAEAKVCFRCLKSGHRAQHCKSFVRCVICQKRHVVLVCPTLKDQPKGNPNKKYNSKTEVSHSNSNTTSERENTRNYLVQGLRSSIVLQTFEVLIVNECNERRVRCLIDSGSERSYISEKCAKQLHLKKNGSFKMIHCLFGGKESPFVNHNKYEVKLMALDRNNTCNLNLLSQNKICSPIQRIDDRDTLKLLEENNIKLNDSGVGNLDIELLVGADNISRILTGKIQKINLNLTGIETVFGWTIIGDTSIISVNQSDSFRSCSSLLCFDVKDLWDLEVLGIQEKTESDDALINEYKNTVKLNDEGRYEVGLPWAIEKTAIGTNFSQAVRRLMSTVKRLKTKGKSKIEQVS